MVSLLNHIEENWNIFMKRNCLTLKILSNNNTFEINGKKFTILILRNMINDKQTRFNQFLNSIEGNNPKTYQ